MERRGTPLRQEGKWACGPCPKCGGDDRFRVVFNGEKGREFFSCRQCGVKGDDIQFLRDFEGMDFRTAKAIAERERGTAPAEPVNVIEDAVKWFDAAAQFVYKSQDSLLGSKRALATIRETRGLNSQTVEKFRVGVNWKQQWVARDVFGLCPRYREDGQEMDLCLPAGIVIPVLDDDALLGVQVRLDEEFRGNRYWTVPGSQLIPMVFPGRDARVVVVVESYLCGMLVWQELAGRVTVLALGSVAIMPKGDAQRLTAEADTVLVALDSDEAGAAQTWGCWMRTYPNAVRCSVPSEYGKDPTEGWLKGLDLAEWVEAGLRLDREGDDPGVPELELSTLAFGSQSARLTIVETSEAARVAARRIAESCPAIGVALDVEAHPEHAQHPLAGHHPRLSRLNGVAVYAEKLREVFVFRMSAGIKKRDLGPLWTLPVVAHDGVEVLRHFALLRKGPIEVGCTRLMANALTNESLPLAKIFARCFSTLLMKGADPDQSVALRVLALADLCPKLNDGLRKREKRAVFHLLQNAQRAVAALEVNGIAFDADAHRALCAEWAAEQARHRAKLPADVNPRSTKEVRRWLIGTVPQERRGNWQRTSTDELSTGDDNLALVDDIPEVHALREYRRLGKLLSSYGAAFAARVNPVTGRLHAKWSLGGMGTGRTAAREPNLQALPRDPAFRALFGAPEGRKLVVADVSQFQLRIAAELAADEAMLRAYADGLDLHTATAATLAGVDAAEVTPEQRRMAKAANFGLLFGQGTEGFREYAAREYQVPLTKREAATIRDKWLRRFQGIARWHEDTMDALRENRPIETAAGREPSAADLAGNALGQALAFQVQGTEAEVMLRALARLHPDMCQHQACLVNFVHDEVVLEVPEDGDAVAAVSAAVERAIADAFRHFFPDATVEGLVEVHAVANWAEAK
jgi:DNA polymerase I-like protein with 3'-5' exonuclease and polymerase domains